MCSGAFVFFNFQAKVSASSHENTFITKLEQMLNYISLLVYLKYSIVLSVRDVAVREEKMSNT